MARHQLANYGSDQEMSRYTGRMPPLGSGGVDVRSIINSIFNIVKSRANQTCIAPCDSFVLKMHYRWTFLFFIACHLTVWYQWYHREVITCVSHFNAEAQVRLDYLNVCFSYPYLELDNGKKRYLLFYRWVPWSFLLLAAIYYIPRKVAKSIENPKVKKLFEDLSNNAYIYDEKEKDLVERAANFIALNMNTHNALYYKNIFLNLIALCIDMLAMDFIDFILQNRFMKLGTHSFPFVRDPEEFSDYISQTFPPFALCTIGKYNQLVAKRTEVFGCHLTLMELYEKLFIFLWVWLIVLIVVTSLYIAFLATMLLPFTRRLLLRTSKPVCVTDKVSDAVLKVCNRARIGDAYMLYRLKTFMSHARFYELLNRISDPFLLKSAGDKLKLLPKDKHFPPKGPNFDNKNVRNRKVTGSPVGPLLSEQLNLLGMNHEMVALPSTYANESQKMVKKNTATSILIE